MRRGSCDNKAIIPTEMWAKLFTLVVPHLIQALFLNKMKIGHIDQPNLPDGRKFRK